MRGKFIHVWDLFFMATFCEGVLFFYVQLFTVTLIMPFPGLEARLVTVMGKRDKLLS